MAQSAGVWASAGRPNIISNWPLEVMSAAWLSRQGSGLLLVGSQAVKSHVGGMAQSVEVLVPAGWVAISHAFESRFGGMAQSAEVWVFAGWVTSSTPLQPDFCRSFLPTKQLAKFNLPLVIPHPISFKQSQQVDAVANNDNL
ncbi:unnamed protein product [Caenorhabditis auriculariae]|uniref:Uncharacterized protein n=1 Tax=Caenorhabditis auriculariae TaxID=2777116 RepID=A0A8S1HT73_9PELO|nr:unnamed protein product [Caenorhabditis auriculariae]